MRAHRRFTTLLVLLIFIVSLAAFCSGEGGEVEHLHDVTMEAPDELFEYEADLVDERLEEEENEMDEQFLKNHQNNTPKIVLI